MPLTPAPKALGLSNPTPSVLSLHPLEVEDDPKPIKTQNAQLLARLPFD